MSDQDAFDRILAALHAATLDTAQWPATSALIDEACGMQGNGLLVSEGPPDAARVLFFGLYYRGQRRVDWEREYLDIYHPIDERMPRARRLPDSHLVHVTELYTAEELQTSPTYNEALPRANAQDSLNVRLDGLDGSSIGWSLQDPVASDGWGSSQLTLLKGLLPHLRHFVRVQQTLAKAQALGASVTALLDNARVGVIHLDRHGRIVEANDRARAILRRGDGVADRGGFLHARVPADQARLERLVADALPTSSAPAVSGSMTLRRASRLARFVVHVKPVGIPQRAFGARRAAALVLIAEPGHGSRIDPALVATTLGLTPVESQLAVWLAEGQTVREMAVATGRTEGSVRWSLHQIHRKQGLSRQADLVRLVLSLAAFA